MINKLRWAAWFKVHLNRTWGILNIPVQLVQVGLLIYLTIKQSGNPVYWLLIPALLVAWVVTWFFDDKWFLTAETKYAIDKSGFWLEWRDELNERLDKIEGKVDRKW